MITDVLEDLDIKRGNRITHITGVTGICDGFTLHMNGSIHAQCLVDAERNKIPERMADEHFMFTKTETGIADILQPIDGPLDFDLGDRVRDKVSKFEGTITSAHISINGCVMYSVTPVTDFSLMSSHKTEFDQHRLEKIKKKKKKEKFTKTETMGGSPAEFGRTLKI